MLLSSGCCATFAPPADRTRWIQDARTTFEGFGIGWALWDYDGNFGLASRDATGRLTYDAPILAALGLQLP